MGIPNGSFMYPQMPYNAASAAAAAAAANYSQYYGDGGFHSICAAEGMPLYQLAGMNGGHSFMSNCPTSYMTPSTANYLNQTAAAAAAAAAYSTPYHQTAGPVTGYTIYPAAMAQAPSQAPGPQSQPPPSMGMHTAPPPTHSMAAAYQHHSQQQAAAAAAVAAANQAHMMANVPSMANAYGHQYSAACAGPPPGGNSAAGPQTAPANSNSAVALHAMRSYGGPLPPGHHLHPSSGQASQVGFSVFSSKISKNLVLAGCEYECI